jgi:hypothetical protein
LLYGSSTNSEHDPKMNGEKRSHSAGVAEGKQGEAGDGCEPEQHKHAKSGPIRMGATGAESPTILSQISPVVPIVSRTPPIAPSSRGKLKKEYGASCPSRSP